MAWIETIRISLGRGSRGEESMRLLEMMEAELALLESGQWELYRNPAVNEELMMVLHWADTPTPDTPSGSDLALMLVRELKKQGLVEYTVWEDVCHK